MLRLDMTRAMKLPAAREFAIPAPFPGKYPTRVGMMVEWERGGETGHWRYVGKPNQIAAKRFEVEVEKGGLRLVAIMEWDRAWKITERLMQWNGPIMAPPAVVIPSLQIVSPWLWTVYHPWHETRGAATAWMRQGVWVHKIGCALGENTRLYGPSPEIRALYVTDYRRRVNVVGQQPARKKRTSPAYQMDYGAIEARTVAAQTVPWAWDTPIQTAPQPAAPAEPTPEPAWRTLARQAAATQRAVQQDIAQNTQVLGWPQQVQEATQPVPGRPRPRQRNPLWDALDRFQE